MKPSDLPGLTEFEQYEDDRTDTVIYGFNKLVKLLLECDPNTCEMLEKKMEVSVLLGMPSECAGLLSVIKSSKICGG